METPGHGEKDVESVSCSTPHLIFWQNSRSFLHQIRTNLTCVGSNLHAEPVQHIINQVTSIRSVTFCLLARVGRGRRYSSNLLSLPSRGSDGALKAPALIWSTPISPLGLPATAGGELCIHVVPNGITVLCN